MKTFSFKKLDKEFKKEGKKNEDKIFCLDEEEYAKNKREITYKCSERKAFCIGKEKSHCILNYNSKENEKNNDRE